MSLEKTHDAIGRRFRDVTVSTGKQIICEDADLDWFEVIHRIGHQTTAALYEVTKDRRTSLNRARERMRDLRHEKNSEYGGPTLIYPLQQTRTIRPDRNLTVYGIAEHAIKALKRAGRYHENTPVTKFQEWKHDFFGSTVTMSFFLACRARPDLYRFHFEDELVARLGRSTFAVPAYQYTMKSGETRWVRDAVLRPDGIFSIEYLPSGIERIFLREEDCKTERNDTERLDVKSHKHNILQYRALIADADTRSKFFGAGKRVVVLYTFSNDTKMQNVMQLNVELSGGRGSNFMLYRSWSDFDDRFRPPAPRPKILTTPWIRAGQDPLDISSI